MGAITPAAFRKSLQARRFAAAYTLYGPEEFLKARALRDLIAAAVDPATRDFNLDVRAGAELDAETLASLLATPPMMAERRLVVIRDAHALKKEPRGVLATHLERAAKAEASDVTLVLEYPEGEKSAPDRAVLERTTAVRYDTLSDRDVPRWVEQHVTRELQVAITPGAVSLLQQAVGADLYALAAELDKLASFTGGAEIDEAAVGAVVGIHTGATVGDLLDALARRDAGAALSLLPRILELPKVGAVPVVMALGTQMLALSWGRARRAEGLNAGRLAGEYFAFLKSGRGAYTGRPWGEAVSAWVGAVDAWDDASLDAALAALLDADIALKGSRVSRDEDILESLVLAICATAGRASARGAAA